MTPAILDVRPRELYVARHRRDAAGIPLEELTARLHELPPRGEALVIYDDEVTRADRAAAMLRSRGREVEVRVGRAWLDDGPTMSGDRYVRLWRPAAWLEESLKMLEKEGLFATALDGPGRLAAIDLACGSGRDAVFLALAAFDVIGIDRLPDALARGRALARCCGVSVDWRTHDLERDGLPPLPPCHLLTVFRYLHRPLFEAIRTRVHPGGVVVCETFLEEHGRRFGKPSKPAHLLAPGELRQAFVGWQIIAAREGEDRQGDFTASIIARRPA